MKFEAGRNQALVPAVARLYLIFKISALVRERQSLQLPDLKSQAMDQTSNTSLPQIPFAKHDNQILDMRMALPRAQEQINFADKNANMREYREWTNKRSERRCLTRLSMEAQQSTKCTEISLLTPNNPTFTMVFQRDGGSDDQPGFQKLDTPTNTVLYAQTIPSPIPVSTEVAYASTTTAYSLPTPDPVINSSPSISWPTVDMPSGLDGNSHDGDDDRNGIPYPVKTGMIIAIVIGIFLIVFLSFWYCCRGKARMARRMAGRENAVLPLHTIASQQPREQPAATGRDAPPPSYEEAVPPQHQRLAGGISLRSEEEDSMVADGKTPLSEIPFEDIDLRNGGASSSSASSNQSFSSRHHNQYGDTTGHTNS
ncbi:hypothetical protein B0O99DRAFT_593735 [Bisporella sp. PMI_857]|nr:hypothetical protein B0O99DRAFT_593735 [Bisporella sp. PMI_857]